VLLRITAAMAHADGSPHPGSLPHAGEGEITELR
jgi:hypothetical protein